MNKGHSWVQNQLKSLTLKSIQLRARGIGCELQINSEVQHVEAQHELQSKVVADLTRHPGTTPARLPTPETDNVQEY